MTTASAPATSSEHRDPLFQSAKHRIASLSSKNEEILDQISKLQLSHSQTLTVINSQLETNGSGQHIDNLINNLKSKQRRSSNSQQQPMSSILKSDKLSNGKDLEYVMEGEDNYEMNESRTIATNDSLPLRKSVNHAMANRKELKKMDHLTPNNIGGELDKKYFSAENNSDSENDNGNSSSIEDKDFDDNNSRRRTFKGHPLLTINTNTTKSLITPESSDSEFDISNAHMPLAPTLGGGRNPLRATRHSSAEHYNGNTTERRGRTSNSLFSSVDDVIEEERGSLSDVAEQSEVNASENIIRMRHKQITSINDRKRAQKYFDENDTIKTAKMHRRPQADDSYADIPDDNSSVMSTDSIAQIQIEELRARIQRLETERDDESERRSQRRKKNHSDSIISPAALSPDSSQGGTSSTTSLSRHSSTASAQQHQKHLQNAFDMFEKAFTTDHPANDSSPPPSHSMAMVVSSALSLNQKLRSVITQMELDGQPSEKRLKALLKTSDEQVRSLTECLLALAPLAPNRVATKKTSGEIGIRGNAYYPNDSSLLQMPAPNFARSISPISRITSAPALYHHESQIGEHVDQFPPRKVSPVPPPDQSSPPNSYYISPRTTSRYSRLSRPTSPTLPPTENYNDSQNSTSRVLDHRERKSRRSSGANPASSSSPSPPPMQHPPTLYDQQGSRAYYEREITHDAPREPPRELPRLQRYNYTVPQQTTSAYQRTTTRPSSFIRTDELSFPLSHHVRTSSTSSTSSIHRSSSGRAYTSRVASEEYVSSPVSTTRSQPPSRLYEYTRRYPSDGQYPIDRRPTPGLETDRRYSRRILNQYEPEEGYDGSNGYVETISERDYIRDDKAGIRRNIPNSAYRQRMVSAQEQKVNGNVGISNGESRDEVNQQDEINHNDVQDVQVNGTNVENGEENDGYI